MLIRLKVNHYNALQATMADRDVRYYLNGFCVDLEARKCIATDGHRMLVVPFEVIDASDKPQIAENESLIYGHTLNQRPKKIPKKGTPDTVEIDTSTDIAEVKSGKQVTDKIVLTRIDGRFPDYKRVLPNGAPLKAVDRIAFNPALVEPIRAALGAHGCIFNFRDKDSAVAVEFIGDQTADWELRALECVVMPMRF